MKYKIAPKRVEEKFIPFTITLTIESRDEAVHFHDKIMGKLTNAASHKFHAGVYKALNNDFSEEEKFEGDI